MSNPILNQLTSLVIDPIELRNQTEIKLKNTLLNPGAHVLLQLLAAQFNFRPSLRKYLKGVDGWINFTIGFQTETNSVEQALIFHQGRVRVLKKIPQDADITLKFMDEDVLREMLKEPPSVLLNLILKNKITMYGNLAYLQLFNYYVSLLMGKRHQQMIQKVEKEEALSRQAKYHVEASDLSKAFLNRRCYSMKAEPVDPGVKYLPEPYLSEYKIDQFPRLMTFLEDHLNQKPEVCAERAKLITEWCREHGFERDAAGQRWNPELRQGLVLKQVMSQKKPIIRKNDLIAGTTTSNPTTGGIIFPDAQGLMIWGELHSIDKRSLIPFDISEETARTLHHDVFPFWAKRNFKAWVKARHNYPICQQIDERWVAYFVWKSVGISHTVPDYPRLLNKGTLGIINDIQALLNDGNPLEEQQKNSLQAMIYALEGVNIYAEHLSREALSLSQKEMDPERKKELTRLVEICARVPAHPPQTLDEALNAVWILWVGIHNENTDTGLSLGRLDQWLQPYFEKDLRKLSSAEAQSAYIRHALELLGCFYMRCTDHFPLGPDIANFLFGGASSTQAVTLGGVTPEGEDGVCDMTYLFLKVTEMLSIRDVNVNARFNPDKNSDTYLKRLCEVNFVTAGTPSMHNDHAVFKALEQHGYTEAEIRDWSATGCVEPTISGKHMGHTGSILMNLVAALEMALNDGYHPLMKWHLGPKTGNIQKGDFHTFEDFFQAYAAQQRFLIGEAVKLNNHLGEVHALYRPTPLLSALMEGSIEKGQDVTSGGAKYNTSGSSNIGLADVTDSLMVIKKLVFDEKKLSFSELKTAIDSNFKNHPALRALVQKKVPLFGSGSAEALEMANRVSGLIHGIYHDHVNFRGGRYTSGFWSMSQHVAYGKLSGALPSGRLAGKSFTPGLTPQPSASNSFLDNIRDVSQLNPAHMDNNIAFNVKLIPSAKDSREKTVETMSSYVHAYFAQGGMQMQFNVVTTETLKDAMLHPENYKNLLVRISGYNAYFVTLNPEIQLELIERAEYGI
ncbi:pyruvate formate lyase family protein [Deltaproteobacteria bacterium TL4]